MKKDIKALLDYLDQYAAAFAISEIHLHGEEEDKKMHNDIRRIRNKYDW
tara:strand:- start:955 stop:1101 length:147 start_codon:yes stop_codon:yes gene_type:complete